MNTPLTMKEKHKAPKQRCTHDVIVVRRGRNRVQRCLSRTVDGVACVGHGGIPSGVASPMLNRCHAIAQRSGHRCSRKAVGRSGYCRQHGGG